MDKFTSMLNKLGLRGSSEDDLRRSAQSTPRLSRNHRIRDTCRDSQRSYGSVGSVENYRIRLNQDWTRELELYAQTQHEQQLLQQQQQQQQQQQLQRREHRRHRSSKKHERTRSHSTEQIPQLGLDRTWDAERARGMELLYQSAERQRERQRQRGVGTSVVDAGPHSSLQAGQKDAGGGGGATRARGRGKKKKKDRHKSASRERSRSHSHDKMELYTVDPPFRSAPIVDPNFTLSQERLERRIDELNKQLLAEKHSSHRDKLTLARLQQEMARQKSERQLRETLVRELERERMLRVAAEQRLREAVHENDSEKSRLKSLQEECQKMDEMAQSVNQFKGKLNSLRQEKTSLAITYENNMQKFRTHVSNLEHENKILLAEIRSMESQCANCHLCNKDISHKMMTNLSQVESEVDKMKVLLERLKMLEAEKSSLVLENENQRQQYEKCLDEIANQVVQALMSQKTLREECAKLQKRVADLEMQNQQLNLMFQQKMKIAPTSVIQSLATKKFSNPTLGTTVTMATSTSGTTTVANGNQTAHTQVTYMGGHLGRGVVPTAESNDFNGSYSEISVESLQSLCSDYNEQLHLEDSLGKAQLSSPPPWLKDQVFRAGESPISSIASPLTMLHAGQSSDGTDLSQNGRQGVTSSSSSERSEQNHAEGRRTSQEGDVGVAAYGTKANEASTSGLESGTTGDGKAVNSSGKVEATRSQPNKLPFVKLITEFPADVVSPKARHIMLEDPHSGFVLPSRDDPTGQQQGLSDVSDPMIANKRSDILKALNELTDKIQGYTKGSMEKLLEDHINRDGALAGHNKESSVNAGDVRSLPSNVFDDSDSDGFSSPRPISNDFSGASTVSLNDLLDRGALEHGTPSDDFSLKEFQLEENDDLERSGDLDSSLGAPNFKDLIQAGKAVLDDSPQKAMCPCNFSQTPASHAMHLSTCPEHHKPGEDASSLAGKPPLPNSSSRGKNQEKMTSAPLGGCLEYSSDSDSDPKTPSIRFPEGDENKRQRQGQHYSNSQGHRLPTSAESAAFMQQIQKMVLDQSRDRDTSRAEDNLADNLGVSRRDYGDYVMLKSPGKLSKPKSQDSGVGTGSDKTVPDNDSESSGATSSSKLTQHSKSTPHPSKPKSSTSASTPEKNAIYQNALRRDNTGVSPRHNVTSSPDSAMQHSFSSSSSSSEIVPGDKPTSRDDGYMSNSAASSSINTSQGVSSPGHGGNHAPKVGKVGTFSPGTDDMGSREKVWTREGICEDMKASLAKRGLIDSKSTSSQESKLSGIVSDMKSVFEGRPRLGQNTKAPNRERRYSVPCTSQEQGECAFMDVDRSTPDRNLPVTSRSSTSDTSRKVSPFNTSRPKMGIPAKTRHLALQQKSRHHSQPALSTYPSDPCLSNCVDRSDDNQNDAEPKLKKTNSDSCLVRKVDENANKTMATPPRPSPCPSNLSTLNDVTPPTGKSSKGNKKQRSKSASTLKERSRSSSLSALRHNKISSLGAGKDKSQCVVATAMIEASPPQLDVKIPGLDPGFLKGAGVRGSGEGSEHGYRSSEEQTKKKAESTSTEQYDSTANISDTMFDVRKYRQLLQADSQWAHPQETEAKAPKEKLTASNHSDGGKSPIKRNSHVPTSTLPQSPLSPDVPESLNHTAPQDSFSRDFDLDRTSVPFGNDSTRRVKGLDAQYASFWSGKPTLSTDVNRSPERDIDFPQSQLYQDKFDVLFGTPYSTQPASSYGMPHQPSHCNLPPQISSHPVQNPLIDSPPPRTSELPSLSSPASPPAGNFQNLMDNLAKKSEDVLKSRIFHREPSDADLSKQPTDYDSLLRINFENQRPTQNTNSRQNPHVKSRQIPIALVQNTNPIQTQPSIPNPNLSHQGNIQEICQSARPTITRPKAPKKDNNISEMKTHLANLTKKVDNFQLDLTKMTVDDLVESCRETAATPPTYHPQRAGNLRVNPLGNHGNNKQWRATIPQVGTSESHAKTTHVQNPRLYRDGFEASDSSCEDGMNFGHSGDSAMRKVRRRKKKPKPQSQHY